MLQSNGSIEVSNLHGMNIKIRMHSTTLGPLSLLITSIFMHSTVVEDEAMAQMNDIPSSHSA